MDRKREVVQCPSAESLLKYLPTARAVLDQELHLVSSIGVVITVLEPFSANFPGATAESWIES